MLFINIMSAINFKIYDDIIVYKENEILKQRLDDISVTKLKRLYGNKGDLLNSCVCLSLIFTEFNYYSLTSTIIKDINKILSTMGIKALVNSFTASKKKESIEIFIIISWCNNNLSGYYTFLSNLKSFINSVNTLHYLRLLCNIPKDVVTC